MSWAWPVSIAWSGVNWMRRKVWSLSGKSGHRLAQNGRILRVVSVGNIQAGGTGKTPLVIEIGRQAAARGLGVCVLTRGYRGGRERSGGVVEPGTQPLDAVEWGDETALLHAELPGAWIGVGADRLRSFEKVLASCGPARLDLVILDDGLQQLRIARDLDLIAMTSRGPGDAVYRELFFQSQPQALEVWTKVRASSQIPATGVSLHFVPKLRGTTRVPGSLLLVSGVGDPGDLARGLSAQGWTVSEHVKRPDHAPYSRAEVLTWLKIAQERGLVLATTFKDFVKWRALGLDLSEVAVFEAVIEWKAGKELWEKALWA